MNFLWTDGPTFETGFIGLTPKELKKSWCREY